MHGSSASEAIAAYHALIEADPSLAEESAAILAERQPSARLTFGGKPLCSVLRPQFLTPTTYAHIQEVCRLLSAAMFRLAEQMQTDSELLEALHLTPEERDLIAVDPGFREATPTTRLDSFLAADSWQFVEFNAETPAAIAYEDVLSEVFVELPLMKAFSRSHRARPLPARDQLRDSLLDAYRQWGGETIPTIAIVDWKGLPTATEHELFAEYFQKSGATALIAEPGELEYDGKRLRARGAAIDLVYRRVLTAELLGQPEAAEPLIAAYKNHHVCVVNSFRSKLLHKKMIFGLLSDERYAHYFSSAERAAIDAHIPWTRQVTDGSSTYAGDAIELIPFIVDNRDRLVLKPNDEYGGKGVKVGWESTPEEWKSAVNEALAEPYVVQARVPVDHERFPAWHENRLEWPELSADLDPFLFGTQVGGVLTRLSAAALLNVTAGTGSLAPTFLVERR
jgi:uncharacterized circularly permuted ATP-grasp superfamily protein